MKNLVEVCAVSLLLVPLLKEGARGQVFEVNEEWNFPAGTLQFGADGSITPIKFESSINAALDADQFTHETKEQGGGTGRGVESRIESGRGRQYHRRRS